MTIDINLSDFDDNEILDEVESRLWTSSFREQLLKIIKDDFEEPDTTLPTMVDEWKRELFMRHYEEFTLEEFEEFLKGKGVLV
jgi:hypothetical protein